MFNGFISTNPRLRKNTKDDSPTTAGAAKVSTVVARSKDELREWGERMGLTSGPRTIAEIRAMSSQQTLWEEAWNSEDYFAALELQSKLAQAKDIDRQWAAKKLWDDQTEPTPEQSAEIWKSLEKFKQTYPQFIQSRVENQVVLLWLKDRNMEVTFPNLVESFEENAFAGKLWLNPSAISAGSETEVSGQDLLRHHNFHKLLQSQLRVTILTASLLTNFWRRCRG
jgi:hypothetical protein